jgi:hypothetical protein
MGVMSHLEEKGSTALNRDKFSIERSWLKKNVDAGFVHEGCILNSTVTFHLKP